MSTGLSRVVVTGMGVVSPIGVGIERFFDGLAQGRSGIGEVSRFDASTFPTRVAAEVPGEVPLSEWCPQALRTAMSRDKKSVFGLAAAEQAVKMAFGALPQRAYRDCRLGLSVAAGLELFDIRDLARHVQDSTFSHHDFVAEALRMEPHAISQSSRNLGQDDEQ